MFYLAQNSNAKDDVSLQYLVTCLCKNSAVKWW